MPSEICKKNQWYFWLDGLFANQGILAFNLDSGLLKTNVWFAAFLSKWPCYKTLIGRNFGKKYKKYILKAP